MTSGGNLDIFPIKSVNNIIFRPEKPSIYKEEREMGVTVRIPTPLRRFTGDHADVEATGGTIGELIDSLEAQHPGIKERLVDEAGGVRRFVNFYVNQEDIRFREGADTPLEDGDSVTILPAIAGGC